MRTVGWAALVGAMLMACPLNADEVLHDQQLELRLQRLETETQTLRAELAQRHHRPQRMSEVVPAAAELPAADAALTAPPPAPVTRDELQAEIKSAAWKKGDLTVTPYGTIWLSMSYETQRSRIGEYVLWIESPEVQGEAGFMVDAKSSRIGFDLVGPPIPAFCGAKITGKVEVDFQGIISTTKNKPGVLLRHAYVEAKTDEYRLLAGQTWDVVSPLYTPTFNYTAGSAAGNLAFRRPQLRGERYWDLSELCLLTLQGSLNMDVVNDYLSDTTIHADHGSFPDLQTRMAVTLGPRTGPDAHPATVGVSGHVGEQIFDFLTPNPHPIDDLEFPTWSFNVDISIPLNERWGFQGEFFVGENLSNYFAGILQGIDRVTRRPIRAMGGFADIWYDWTPSLHSHFGYSIDDPFNQDLTVGRTCNSYFYSNVVYDFSKNLNAGVEISSWRTSFTDLRPGEAMRVEFVTKYRF